MAKYVDRNGGLVVEKKETELKKTVENTTIGKSVSVSGVDAVDTLQSYHSFSSNDASSKGVCKICGKQTAYKNRHICVDCWKLHCDEIIQGLKTAVKEVEFQID